ncbi:MAG: hypothetical protein ACRCX2_12265 [Paraclostridium sp.]
MSDCCLIKKVATVVVYENKIDVKAYGFMVGDTNIANVEVLFKHKFGEADLSIHDLAWYIKSSDGTIFEGLAKIENDKSVIPLPNEIFRNEKNMKVQLTILSKDKSQALNIQQFVELVVKNQLA